MILLLLAALAITIATTIALRRDLTRPRPAGTVTVTLTADVSGFTAAMQRAGRSVASFTTTRPVKAGEEMVVGDNVEPVGGVGYRDSRTLALVFDREKAARLRVFIRQQPWPERLVAAHICAELGKAGVSVDQIINKDAYWAVRRVRERTDLDLDGAIHAVAAVTAFTHDPTDAVLLVPTIRRLGGTR